MWGERKGGQAFLVATGCEVSLATDVGVVLAEMSVVGWRVASYAKHSRSVSVDFLRGLCMKEGCSFPISGSRVACRPRAEEQQQPCSQCFSISYRAVLWSVPMHGGKGLEVLSFRRLLSKQ